MSQMERLKSAAAELNEMNEAVQRYVEKYGETDESRVIANLGSSVAVVAALIMNHLMDEMKRA